MRSMMTISDYMLACERAYRKKLNHAEHDKAERARVELGSIADRLAQIAEANARIG